MDRTSRSHWWLRYVPRGTFRLGDDTHGSHDGKREKGIGRMFARAPKLGARQQECNLCRMMPSPCIRIERLYGPEQLLVFASRRGSRWNPQVASLFPSYCDHSRRLRRSCAYDGCYIRDFRRLRGIVAEQTGAAAVAICSTWNIPIGRKSPFRISATSKLFNRG